MKKFISEFKEFISRGSVIDLAVGLIMGSAFTAIVSSLVNDIVMPLIGAIFGGIDFTTLRWVIRAADEAKGIEEASLNYGSFIQAIVNFILIALVIFLVIKAINGVRAKLEKKKEEEEEKEEETAEEEPSEEVLLLREIRDSLKK